VQLKFIHRSEGYFVCRALKMLFLFETDRYYIVLGIVEEQIANFASERVNKMTDVENVYEHIVDFLGNETEKTLLLSGIADKEKHRSLLKALNAREKMKGLIYLIHTTKDGMKDFFRWAELYKVKVPNKYGQAMQLSNLTIFFDNLTTKNDGDKYDNCALDFMILWPIASVTKNKEEIQMLEEMTKRQRAKKIIYLTIKEPWCKPESLESIVDRVIKLDCENDAPEEYRRILTRYEEDRKRRNC